MTADRWAPPESVFLSLACRAALDGAPTADLARAASSCPRWDLILAWARAERLGPLLTYSLDQAGLGQAPSIPAPVRDSLRREYLAAAAKFAILSDAAGQLLRAFGPAGIPVIVLKGMALAETAYPNPALRPMEDLDLMVRASDLDGTVQVLRDAGYREAWHGFPDFEREDGLIDVDLHTGLIHGGLLPTRREVQGIQTDVLWTAAQPASIGGAPALVLAPHHQLFHLCSHLLYHHGLQGLLWHADVLALVGRHPDLLSADLLNRLAAESPGGRALYYGLASCHARLGLILPSGLLEAVRPRDLTGLEAWLRPWATSGRLPWFFRYYFVLRGLPTTRQRAGFARELAVAWWERRGRWRPGSLATRQSGDPGGSGGSPMEMGRGEDR